MAVQEYNEDSIRSLDWKEHIRLRPGMYIGKMGNGSSPDDGVYILLKEVIDNSIDEFVMDNGKTIEVTVRNNKVSVRDFGRGIPLGKVVDVVSKINTGAKYDSKVFKKSVGLNGVGSKAANALSSYFCIRSIRDGKSKFVEFEQGIITNDEEIALLMIELASSMLTGSELKHHSQHLKCLLQTLASAACKFRVGAAVLLLFRRPFCFCRLTCGGCCAFWDFCCRLD